MTFSKCTAIADVKNISGIDFHESLWKTQLFMIKLKNQFCNFNMSKSEWNCLSKVS